MITVRLTLKADEARTLWRVVGDLEKLKALEVEPGAAESLRGKVVQALVEIAE